uniref:ATP-binding cassette sub-family G member 4-like n=1 Tax=Erpetoichthys calabaricus TaxID=27687 RepID=A0A8C4XBV2_ERPCA
MIILKDLSGKFCSGELIGIMGICGAGKSTLMDILAGMRKKGVEGQILVNGQQQKRRTFKKLSCYISQFHSLYPNLTVLESMMVKDCAFILCACLQVNETLNALLLKEYADVQTSILSVGHQKLLSIALELLRNPSVMFLDEPTSTVCGYFSFKVISLLKSLAQSGRTIVCIIHQPCCDILNLFDKLYILSQGQCVYSGTVSYLTTFLAKFGLHCRKYHSPAALTEKHYQRKRVCLLRSQPMPKRECHHGMHVNPMLWAFYDSTIVKQCRIVFLILSQKDVDPMESDEFVTSTFSQFCVLLKRSFIYDYLQLVGHPHQTPIAFSLVIYVYLHDIYDSQSISLLIFLTSFFTCPLQMPVVLKEHHNNWYSLKAYYLAKMMSDMPMQIIGPIIYCCIAYWMTSQPPKATLYVLFAGLLILVAFVTQSVGQFIAAMCDSLMVCGANAMAWVVGAIMCIFGGFFGPFDELASYRQVSWSKEMASNSVCSSRYSFGGMVLSLYGINRTDLECAEGIYPLQKPETILKELKNDEAKLVVDIHILVIYFIIFHLAAYLALCYKARPSRRKTEYKN